MPETDVLAFIIALVLKCAFHLGECPNPCLRLVPCLHLSQLIETEQSQKRNSQIPHLIQVLDQQMAMAMEQKVLGKNSLYTSPVYFKQFFAGFGSHQREITRLDGNCSNSVCLLLYLFQVFLFLFFGQRMARSVCVYMYKDKFKIILWKCVIVEIEGFSFMLKKKKRKLSCRKLVRWKQYSVFTLLWEFCKQHRVHKLRGE